MNLPLLKLRAQLVERALAFRDKNQTGSFDIEAMEQSRLPTAFTDREQCRPMRRDVICQRAALACGKTMGCHPCRLIEHQQRRILIDDVDVELRRGRRVLRQPTGGTEKFHFRSGGQSLAFLRDSAVAEKIFLPNCMIEFTPR